MDIHTTQIKDRDRLEARTDISLHLFVNEMEKGLWNKLKKFQLS
jgi:hypothetical protein